MMKEPSANVDSFYQYTCNVHLNDFVVVEFARAWADRHAASVVDPEVVAEVVADPEFGGDDDDGRLLRYARALLQRRVTDEDGLAAIARIRSGLTAAKWLAPLVGVLVGGLLLEASLPPNDVRPVNVFVLLGEGVVIPAVFLVLTLVAATRLHWLGPLMGVLRKPALETETGRLTRRVLERSGVAAPLLASLSHRLWIGALGAMLATAALRFTFDDYLFCWSSTLPVTGEDVGRIFAILALPVEWLPGIDAPTAEQVTVSQWASLEGAWPRGTGDAVRDTALRKGWYALMLAVVACWGLLPRLGAWVEAEIRIRRGVARALASPEHRRILASLHAAVTVVRTGDGTGERDALPPSRASGGGAARAGEGLDVVAFAASSPKPARLEALGLARLGLSGRVRALDDDDKTAADALLDAFSDPDRAPGGAIVAFDVRSSPDRVREAFLRDVVAALGSDAPVHVLLVGTGRYRGDVAARRAVWVEVAERAGVAAERVHDDGAAA